jgi:hypothetical protein
MKRVLFGVVAAIVLFTAGAVAQDRIFGWQLHQDRNLPDHPCGANGLLGSAQPFFYDHQALVFYTCNDNRVIVRTFYNPQDNVREAQPVYVIQGPSAPAPTVYCPTGLVPSKGGGCVPANHPDAAK